MKNNTSASPLETALDYIARGWQPLPVSLQTKKPTQLAWQNCPKLTAKSAAGLFNGGMINVGIQMGVKSNGLTDVDLDCREAIIAAPLLLPKTGATFGRKSKPSSHWLYTTGLAGSIDKAAMQFHDSDDNMMLELRIGGGGKGAQSVFPGSTHTSGEAIEWFDAGDPATVDDATLLQQVKRLAVVTILARYWPREGKRHDAALTVGGFLARAGFDEKSAKLMLKAIAKAAGDNEVSDRENAARDAVRGFHKKEKTAGFPKMVETFDTDVAERVADWLNYNAEPPSEAAATTTVPEKRPWPKLDPAALYGLTGEVVNLFEPHTEADPVALALQFLTYFGNAIDRGPHHMIEGDAHRCNLFVVLVGDTAKARKGTSAGRIRQLMKYVDPVWLDTCCKGGLSSGEGLAWEIRDAVMRTNKDGEEVQVVDPVLDKRLLAEEREFAQVLSVMRREGSTLSISLRTAWDSHPLNSLTKNSPAKCSEPHISVIGHITEQELRRALDDTSVANGFANRFLFACVTRSKFLPFGSKLDEEAIKAVAQKVLDVFHRFYVDEIEITMDEEASKLWGEVYRELSTGKPGMLGAIIARADAQTKRLALVYAVLDCSDTIKLPHLKAALAVTRYSEDSAAYIFGDALGDHVADEILRTIRATGKMSRTDINNLFARNLTAAKIGAALVTLLEHKRVQRVMQQQSGSKGGRPTEYWMSS